MRGCQTKEFLTALKAEKSKVRVPSGVACFLVGGTLQWPLMIGERTLASLVTDTPPPPILCVSVCVCAHMRTCIHVEWYCLPQKLSALGNTDIHLSLEPRAWQFAKSSQLTCSGESVLLQGLQDSWHICLVFIWVLGSESSCLRSEASQLSLSLALLSPF